MEQPLCYLIGVLVKTPNHVDTAMRRRCCRWSRWMGCRSSSSTTHLCHPPHLGLYL
ncbi:hypothetical protein HanIR_Chr14g0692351 [Helianthus annuus]|nr:hypothetical protein HanIR_Chr14g0692351 [Helianthus annuus]